MDIGYVLGPNSYMRNCMIAEPSNLAYMICTYVS